MKRIFALLLVGLMLLGLVACGPYYKTKTAEFYGSIDKTSFWYTGEVTSGTEVYNYTQAVDSDSCTTIEDHIDNSKDGYVIYDGKYLHSINVSAKKYDTKKTEQGVNFLFGENDYKSFNTVKVVTDAATFDGETLYCEIFSTVDKNGNETGENKYYFRDDRLVAIEWVENDKVTITLRIKDYSSQIPSDIYLSIPDDFRAGTFTTEQVVEPWGETSK